MNELRGDEIHCADVLAGLGQEKQAYTLKTLAIHLLSVFLAVSSANHLLIMVYHSGSKLSATEVAASEVNDDVATERPVAELEKQVSSQRDELQGQEKQVAAQVQSLTGERRAARTERFSGGEGGMSEWPWRRSGELKW